MSWKLRLARRRVRRGLRGPSGTLAAHFGFGAPTGALFSAATTELQRQDALSRNWLRAIRVSGPVTGLGEGDAVDAPATRQGARPQSDDYSRISYRKRPSGSLIRHFHAAGDLSAGLMLPLLSFGLQGPARASSGLGRGPTTLQTMLSSMARAAWRSACAARPSGTPAVIFNTRAPDHGTE
jgi:hypothetical protein